jgi:hypothetical protein
MHPGHPGLFAESSHFLHFYHLQARCHGYILGIRANIWVLKLLLLNMLLTESSTLQPYNKATHEVEFQSTRIYMHVQKPPLCRQNHYPRANAVFGISPGRGNQSFAAIYTQGKESTSDVCSLSIIVGAWLWFTVHGRFSQWSQNIASGLSWIANTDWSNLKFVL